MVSRRASCSLVFWLLFVRLMWVVCWLDRCLLFLPLHLGGLWYGARYVLLLLPRTTVHSLLFLPLLIVKYSIQQPPWWQSDKVSMLGAPVRRALWAHAVWAFFSAAFTYLCAVGATALGTSLFPGAVSCYVAETVALETSGWIWDILAVEMPSWKITTACGSSPDSKVTTTLAV